MSIKQDLVNFLHAKGCGHGEEHAIHCTNGELVRTSDEHPLSVLRRLRELHKDKIIDYEYMGKNKYRIWFQNNQGGEKEGEGGVLGKRNSKHWPDEGSIREMESLAETQAGSNPAPPPTDTPCQMGLFKGGL